MVLFLTAEASVFAVPVAAGIHPAVAVGTVAPVITTDDPVFPAAVATVPDGVHGAVAFNNIVPVITSDAAVSATATSGDNVAVATIPPATVLQEPTSQGRGARRK